MGLFNTTIPIHCKSCRKWFDVSVGSFLGLRLADTEINGKTYITVTGSCPRSDSLVHQIVSE